MNALINSFVYNINVTREYGELYEKYRTTTLLPETDIEYLENFYPGIGYANIKQIYVAMASVTNALMEIALVEVADSSDVAAIWRKM